MISANEFWLHLHILAEAYEAEGPTKNERAENIAEQFRNMPRVTQRELFNDLVQLMTACADVYGIVIADRQAESAQREA